MWNFVLFFIIARTCQSAELYFFRVNTTNQVFVNVGKDNSKNYGGASFYVIFKYCTVRFSFTSFLSILLLLCCIIHWKIKRNIHIAIRDIWTLCDSKCTIFVLLNFWRELSWTQKIFFCNFFPKFWPNSHYLVFLRMHCKEIFKILESNCMYQYFWGDFWGKKTLTYCIGQYLLNLDPKLLVFECRFFLLKNCRSFGTNRE